MFVEYLIGWRYTRGKKDNHFISFVSLISILGIAVGITVIITVLSVMNGFKEEIRNKILDVVSHNTLSSLDGTIDDWELLRSDIENEPNVEAIAPFVEMQVMLMNGDKVRGAYARGIAPELEKEVSNITSYLKEGSLESLEPGLYRIILGHSLAFSLSAELGDKVTLISPQAAVTPAGVLPRMRSFVISGIFDTGLSEFDRGIVLLNLEDARRLARLEDKVNGIRLRLDDLFQSPEVSKSLNLQLGPHYWISDWTRNHRNFFRALEMEKLLLFLIMALIITVAAFNIISMLVMVVIEKQSDIAILRTMGMQPTQVMKVFITQGCLIGFMGNIIGVGGGVLLASYIEDLVTAIESATGFKFLSPDVYPITEVPSKLMESDVIVVATLTFVMTVLSTLYPAWRASRLKPAEVLRSG